MTWKSLSRFRRRGRGQRLPIGLIVVASWMVGGTLGLVLKWFGTTASDVRSGSPSVHLVWIAGDSVLAKSRHRHKRKTVV